MKRERTGHRTSSGRCSRNRLYIPNAHLNLQPLPNTSLYCEGIVITSLNEAHCFGENFTQS